MKLTNLYNAAGERVLGLVEGDRVYDLFKASGNRPEFASLGKWLHAGNSARAQADKLREQLVRDASAGTPLSEAKLAPMADCDARIFCVGLNYADHAAETGQAIPAEPILFNKAPNTLIGPDDDVRLPRGSVKTDWEVELGVVIGKRASYLETDEEVRAAIAGYTLVNDVSEREFQQERGGQWVKGKSAETFNPAGPWLATQDEIADVNDLSMWLDVNGVRRQTGSTKTMIFDAYFVVRYISQFMVLEPGDLINTGTPPGVGLGMKPPLYLAEGDVMTLGVQGLGSQRQRVIGPR
jgi:2,4-diketo-3-deoxy-L-fuconate hydrolase